MRHPVPRGKSTRTERPQLAGDRTHGPAPTWHASATRRAVRRRGRFRRESRACEPSTARCTRRGRIGGTSAYVAEEVGSQKMLSRHDGRKGDGGDEADPRLGDRKPRRSAHFLNDRPVGIEQLSRPRPITKVMIERNDAAGMRCATANEHLAALGTLPHPAGGNPRIRRGASELQSSATCFVSFDATRPPIDPTAKNRGPRYGQGSGQGGFSA